MATSRPLALATHFWLGASLLGALADAVATGFELSLLSSVAAGEARVDARLRDALEDAATRAELLFWVRVGLLLPTAIVYLAWLARAVKRHQVEVRVTPTRAVLEYLIPIAQLALPYRTMGRLLAATGARRCADWTRFVWWSAWLVALLTGQLARQADASALNVEGFARAAGLALASDLSVTVAGIAGMRLVACVERGVGSPNRPVG